MDLVSPGRGKMTALGITCWSATKANFEIMKELGCTEFYSVVEWCNHHKSPDHYYWSQLDKEFALEEQYGIKSIRVIMHTPLWASGVDRTDCKFRPRSYPPRTLEYYGRFCAALVRRYPDREWILWGEPDNSWPREDAKIIQWAGDAETYAKMAKYAYVEMKKADSKCVVGLGSLVGATLNGTYRTVVENNKPLNKLPFFEKLLELDMGNYCDFIPLDLYCWGYGGSRNFLAGIRKIKGIMADFNVKKPLYIMECGAKITPPGGKMREEFHHEVVNEETQAGFLLRAYKWSQENKIDKLFWHTLKDSNWGVINRLGRPHLSYHVFKAMKAGSF